MVYAADNTSLIVLRDLLVNGEVKETMEAFWLGIGSQDISKRERRSLSDGFTSRVSACRLTFHRPIDALPLCCCAELRSIVSFSFVLIVSPGNNSLGNLCLVDSLPMTDKTTTHDKLVVETHCDARKVSWEHLLSQSAPNEIQGINRLGLWR